MEQNKTLMASPIRHFTKHLFLTSKVYSQRNKAKEDVSSYLHKMRRSIIRMRLSYSDIDRLKEKINKLIDWERKYARFFKPDDTEMKELKKQVQSLEQELRNGREEKYRLIEENNEKLRQLTESLSNIKSQARYLFMEKAKRQQRLRALDQKINGKVDVHRYYGS